MASTTANVDGFALALPRPDLAPFLPPDLISGGAIFLRLDLLSRLRRSVSARAAFAVSALIASQTPGWLSAIGSMTGAGLFLCVSASATATPALCVLAWAGAVGGDGTGPLVAVGRGAGTAGGVRGA